MDYASTWRIHSKIWWQGSDLAYGLTAGGGGINFLGFDAPELECCFYETTEYPPGTSFKNGTTRALDARRGLCKSAEESNLHLVLTCPFVHLIWE